MLIDFFPVQGGSNRTVILGPQGVGGDDGFVLPVLDIVDIKAAAPLSF